MSTPVPFPSHTSPNPPVTRLRLADQDPDFEILDAGLERTVVPMRNQRLTHNHARARRLPAFVPFDSSGVLSARDPWTVRSLNDLLRIYLPEASIAAGLVIVSGVIAGRIYGALVLNCGPFVFPAIYAGTLLLWFTSICIQAKAYPSALTRSRVRSTLLGSLMIFGAHLVGYLVARATTVL